MKLLKGGIETIIVVVLLVAVVVGLFIAVVIPMANTTVDIGDEGIERLDEIFD